MIVSGNTSGFDRFAGRATTGSAFFNSSVVKTGNNFRSLLAGEWL